MRKPKKICVSREFSYKTRCNKQVPRMVKIDDTSFTTRKAKFIILPYPVN